MKLSNLPLRPSTLSTLLEHGYQTTSEVLNEKTRVKGGSIGNFATELGISLSEALSLTREIEQCLRSLTRNENETGDANPNNDSQQQPTTAASLLLKHKQTSSRPIITFCKSIDDLLGGGFATHEVTEVVGLPGVGKTQLAMQVCIDAFLPMCFGGVAGEAVYIDTEGSLSPERCRTMAQALVDHIGSSARKRKRSVLVPDWFCVENILRGIHVYRVHDEAALTATIYALSDFLKERKKMGGTFPVKVIVIDSIAFHYRSTTENTDFKLRTSSLMNIASFLSNLASDYELAVLVINQMTTKFVHNPSYSNNTTAIVTPALGESWAHATTNRLLLSMAEEDGNRKEEKAQKRVCALVKSPHKPNGKAFFMVTDVGVRDAA